MNPAWNTIAVELEPPVCTLRFARLEARNTINAELIGECRRALAELPESVSIVVIEGSPEVFSFGADFHAVERDVANGVRREQDPGPLYDLWLELATGPLISVAHVRGQANAGGIGFVAACDIVLADPSAVFSLSELLFGLYPACVLPFLIRRVGRQRAHYLTLMTQPIGVESAHQWGLVDAYDRNSADLLRRHLLRLRRLNRTAVARYKRYLGRLDAILTDARDLALQGNREVFADPRNVEMIARYVATGLFPWENPRP